MKKYTLILAFALILGFTGCAGGTPSGKSADSIVKRSSVSQSTAESSTTASDEESGDTLQEKFDPVSQDEDIFPEESLDPSENSDTQSQSDGIQEESAPAKDHLVQETSPSAEVGTGEAADEQVYSAAEPEQMVSSAIEETDPEPQTEISSQSSVPETSIASEPEPASAEESRSIYDYEFDVEAIRAELISLGESMGLSHITSDGGIACTPDTCSWASPITASQSLQGENLKRALQSYVSSMPSIVSSYGGGAISYFTIYVQDNGGGSYTFYFLY